MTSLRAALAALGLASVCAAGWSQAQIELHADSDTVPRYGRAEFVLGMAQCVGDPLDPAEVDVALEITPPDGGRLVLPCFYYQDYERRRVGPPDQMREWLYPVGEPTWRARFAPTQLGRYTCRAIRRCRGETALSGEATFECAASDSRGFVRVSARNPRYFEYSEGGPCFLIGQNLAFVPDTFREEELLRKLGAAGGNFARVWACCEDWAMSLQGRKSAWGRSWDWNPPLSAEPGREGFHSGRLCIQLTSAARPQAEVAPSRPVAVRPDTAYVLAGRVRTQADAQLAVSLGGTAPAEPLVSPDQWIAFEVPLRTGGEQWWLGQLSLRIQGEGAAWVTDLSLREAGGGPELLGEADVNRPVLGDMNLLDCYMMDKVVETAEAAGVHLQVVLLPRDPYWEVHPSLKRGGQDGPDYDRAIRDARNLLRYAVARWGYSTSIGAWEYFNEIDPASPTNRFYDELGQYLEQVDLYRHPRTTSTWGPSLQDWAHPRLDAVNLHRYLRPVDGEAGRDEVVALFDTTRDAFASEHRKPILVAEFGLADDNWGVSPDLERDRGLVHLHHANWGAALSGLAGTVMPWWWDQLDALDVCALFPPLARFVADIPYTTAELERVVRADPGAPVRVVGLCGREAAYLWVADPEATWWRTAVEQAPLREIREAIVPLDGLAPGRYAVEWWNTRTGEVTPGDEVRYQGGALELSVPAFRGDIACKVLKQAD